MTKSTPHWFFLELPLYERVEWEGEQVFDYVELLHFDGVIDCYCVDCSRDATFKGRNSAIPLELARKRYCDLKAIGGNPLIPILPTATYRVSLECTRNPNHRLTFLYHVMHKLIQKNKGEKPFVTRGLQKIGQLPSYADLNIPALKKYSSVLDKNLMGELSRAIGLASHDVGIGSFVYLRRVLEALVEEYHQQAMQGDDWNEEEYSKARMAEKISQLRDLLPSFLVENPKIYGLLSKGVHELGESECLAHFDTLRICIELILDQRLESKNQQQKLEAARKALNEALGSTDGDA